MTPINPATGRLARQPKPLKMCEHANCINKHSSKGYCSMHAAQLRRHGKTFDAGTLKQKSDHGQYAHYSNHGCRCELCSVANNAYAQGRKSVHASYAREGQVPNLEHGTNNAYSNYGCRCDDCSAARAAYSKNKYSAWSSIDVEAERNLRNGVCDCCGLVTKKLVFDHDHETAEFRGFLCNTCNTGLGKLGDSIEGLQRALNYLHSAAQRNLLT